MERKNSIENSNKDTVLELNDKELLINCLANFRLDSFGLTMPHAGNTGFASGGLTCKFGALNLRLKEPKPDVFKGKLYVLMNGTCFSSAADLISDLKKATNAFFIGEESGGTFEAPTGGDNIVIQLPNCKIMIRISPNIQIGYMYEIHPIGRGVLPTFAINYTVKDLV